MLGRKERDQLELFISGSLRQLVPDDHILAPIDARQKVGSNAEGHPRGWGAGFSLCVRPPTGPWRYRPVNTT